MVESTSTAMPAAVKRKKRSFRSVCAVLHRDLGYFFAGIVLIYAISGIAMNHRHTFNPNYSVDYISFDLPHGVASAYEDIATDDIRSIFEVSGCAADQYTKHFKDGDGRLKILVKGGSSITADLHTRTAVYEKISPRKVLGPMVRLHYNPGKWWLAFSDVFAISLALITLTGLFILKGKNGIKRRGVILVGAGLLFPLIFLCF